MAGNAQWCLTLEEWRSRFQHWFASGSPDALLHGTIFFDLRALTGDRTLAQALRDWLTAHAPEHPRFLHLMTQNALRNRVPLGAFGQYKTDGHGNIDLKLNGTTLFADAARIFALGSGLDETNTERRLRESGLRLNIPPAETEAWIAAYYCLQGHRLRNQAGAIAKSARPDNALAPAGLNDYDRAVLKLALRQAMSLQKRLAMQYGAA
jgi:CBS domain-containing protein